MINSLITFQVDPKKIKIKNKPVTLIQVTVLMFGKRV